MSDYFFAKKKDVDSADVPDAGKAEKPEAIVSGESFAEWGAETKKIKARTRA